MDSIAQIEQEQQFESTVRLVLKSLQLRARSGFLKKQSQETLHKYAITISEILFHSKENQVYAIDLYIDQIRQLICWDTMAQHNKILSAMFDDTYQFLHLLFEGVSFQIEQIDQQNGQTVECYHYKFNLNGCKDGESCPKIHSKKINDFQYVVCLLEILKRKDWPEVQKLCKKGSNCTYGKQCRFRHLKLEDVIPVSRELKRLTEEKLAKKTYMIEKKKLDNSKVKKCDNGLECKFFKKGTCNSAHPIPLDEAQVVYTPKHTTDNRSKIPCRYGAKCNDYASGNCMYQHHPNSSLTEETKQSFEQEPGEAIKEKPKELCNYGSTCPWQYKKSGCRSIHTNQDRSVNRQQPVYRPKQSKQ